MASRPFAYADVFRHPPVSGGAAFGGGRQGGHIRPGIAAAVASVCKNESNCTVFLDDGTWFSTWSQGSHEGHPDQRIVSATSSDMGSTWTEPRTVCESRPEHEENVAYGIPFAVPGTGRIYIIFFVTANTEGKLWAEEQRLDPSRRRYPLHQSGRLHFSFSDDGGLTWSSRHRIELPGRGIDVLPGRVHGWLNHPPQIMPDGAVIFTYSAAHQTGAGVLPWQLSAGEVYVVRCDNILGESDPSKLTFTVSPSGPRGIRTNVRDHWQNAALQRHLAFYGGVPEDTGWSYQEMTVVAVEGGGRWLGVGRTYLGSPGLTVSDDSGETWSAAEPLRYAPRGEAVAHPMTMCPLATAGDGRLILLFTNNDGSRRGARNLWDGGGTTRNPLWMAVGRHIPGERENGGLVLGEPQIIAQVDDSGEVNLKTGISMPQFLQRGGRHFVCYNIDKEHILLDEIPASVLDEMTPS